MRRRNRMKWDEDALASAESGLYNNLGSKTVSATTEVFDQPYFSNKPGF